MESDRLNCEFSEELSAVMAKSDRESGSLWLPVTIHSLDTAGIIEKLCDMWLPESTVNYLSSLCGDEDTAKRVMKFCALVHDIGKTTPVFQAKIAAAAGWSPFEKYYHKSPDYFYDADKTPHALASEVILLDHGCPCGIASVCGAHHGKPPANDIILEEESREHPRNYYDGKVNKELFERIRMEWLTFALKYSGFDEMRSLPDIPIPAQTLICGLLIVSDWIASNTQYFPLIPADSTGSLSDHEERVDEAWERLSFPRPWYPDSAFGMTDDMFETRFGFPPNATQSEIISEISVADPGGIYIIEAPMGLGKTEAALACAEILSAKNGAGGLFFGLPTQATSNGIFPRLEKWAKSLDSGALHSIKLAHAAAELNDDYRDILDGHGSISDENGGGLIVHEWFSGRKQALLSDFVIGTVDQLLMAALKQKHFMLRHLGLAGKVVVIDECHAYDAYMSGYLDTALSWLGRYGVPVVILSATLPADKRKEFICAYIGKNPKRMPEGEWMHSLDYPQLVYTKNGVPTAKKLTYSGPQRSVALSRITSKELCATIGYAVNRGGCAGVIVNTVKKAQELAAELRAAFPESDVIMIHAQFIMTERAKREKAILDRVGKASTPEERHGLIIVGTQVLEQSLDMDFDVMVTELCPTDLLLQRIGRLHRHSRLRPAGLETAMCFILDGENEENDSGSASIYGDWLLAKTRSLLPESITIPDDIPVLVGKTYDDSEHNISDDMTNEMWLAYNEYETAKKTKSQKSMAYRLQNPPEPDTPVHRNVLDGILDNSIQINEAAGEMAVRDGDPSIDVLALIRKHDGTVHLFGDETLTVPTDRIPSREEALIAARQKLRLPGYFCKTKKRYGEFCRADMTVSELEKQTEENFPEWKNSSLLKDELVLLFDSNHNALLCGAALHYDMDSGLTYEIKNKGETQ